MDVVSPPSSGAPERRSGHRRRGPSLEAALLDAAWDELHIVGYAALTMDGVAARAGTSKAVLYRRWQNRGELILATLHMRRPMVSGEVPDTGNLRGDVIALLRRASAGISEIGTETIFGLLDELARGSEAAAYLLPVRSETRRWPPSCSLRTVGAKCDWRGLRAVWRRCRWTWRAMSY